MISYVKSSSCNSLYYNKDKQHLKKKLKQTFKTISQRSTGEAIDCFKCVSIGGDNSACDDPFHNNGSLEFLQSPCLGGRKGRDGLFPATACVKLAGVYGKLHIHTRGLI